LDQTSDVIELSQVRRDWESLSSNLPNFLRQAFQTIEASRTHCHAETLIGKQTRCFFPNA
jgi:hypothetical protein